jgi:Uncharacterized conserved protein
MPVPFQGGCRCGAIRYEVTAEPVLVADCHCRDCQYASGTSHMSFVVVPKDAFHLLKGSTEAFDLKADSGHTVSRHFCPRCGTPLLKESGDPVWAIAASSLDDPSALKIEAAVFVKSAQPWAQRDSAIPAFQTMPD